MKKSESLQVLPEKILDALLSADHETYRNFISPKDGTLMIGSSPEEWVEGYPQIVKQLKMITDGFQGLEVAEVKTSAYEEGTVGWTATQFKLQLPNGTGVPFRLTAIFVREEDGWKFVQWHDSIGVPDEMMMAGGSGE